MTTAEPADRRCGCHHGCDCGRLERVWRIDGGLFLGDYRSGEDALAGAERPAPPQESPAPFAGVVSLCPMPLLSDEAIEGPAYPTTEWLRVAIVDGGSGDQEFEAALGVIVPFVKRRLRYGNVLVHCAAGMSRSVAVVAALLCERGWTVKDSLRHVAESKARALAPFAGDPDELVAPAWEFVRWLERRYSGFDAASGPG